MIELLARIESREPFFSYKLARDYMFAYLWGSSEKATSIVTSETLASTSARARAGRPPGPSSSVSIDLITGCHSGYASASAATSKQRSRSAAISIVPSPPKSVIMLMQFGGPSHIDTFDMKPDAIAEVRGEFRPVRSRLPGAVVIVVGEQD